MGVKIHSTLGSVTLESQNVTGTQTLYIPSVSGNKTLLTTDGDGSNLTGVNPFPSGTKMVFYQASAPTGWTKDTTQNDKALRVVSGTGGGTGGTHAMSSPPSTSHTHTGPSHTHSTPAHSHTHTLSAGAHTLSTSEMPSHDHDIKQGYTSSGTAIEGGNSAKQIATTNTTAIQNTGGGGSHSHSLSGSITSGGSGTSGSGGTGATSSSGPTAFAPQYIDVIVCSKN